MQIICLEEKAFYTLLEIVLERLKSNPTLDAWVSREEAMRILNIKSKSTLAELRYHGKIRYSQPQKKIILYDRASLLEYLERHSKNKF